ncbi:hypothetical protein ABZX92_44795, partial [Lentzea sp. NPDC006480]|uniref:hypothetical protein n=1 Tax=Lentzea sp. NPDC006480 TaxID=3157176 RepID=UPI0033AE93DF
TGGTLARLVLGSEAFWQIGGALLDSFALYICHAGRSNVGEPNGKSVVEDFWQAVQESGITAAVDGPTHTLHMYGWKYTTGHVHESIQILEGGYWASRGRSPVESSITAAEVWELVPGLGKMPMDVRKHYASRIPVLEVVDRALWVSFFLELGLERDGVLDLVKVRGLVEAPWSPGVPAVRADLVWETAIKLVQAGDHAGLLSGVVVPADLMDLSRHGFWASDLVRVSDGREVWLAGWWGPVPVLAHVPAPVVPGSALPASSGDGTVSSGVTLDPSVASVLNESVASTSSGDLGDFVSTGEPAAVPSMAGEAGLNVGRDVADAVPWRDALDRAVAATSGPDGVVQGDIPRASLSTEGAAPVPTEPTPVVADFAGVDKKGVRRYFTADQVQMRTLTNVSGDVVGVTFNTPGEKPSAMSNGFPVNDGRRSGLLRDEKLDSVPAISMSFPWDGDTRTFFVDAHGKPGITRITLADGTAIYVTGETLAHLVLGSEAFRQIGGALPDSFALYICSAGTPNLGEPNGKSVVEDFWQAVRASGITAAVDGPTRQLRVWETHQGRVVHVRTETLQGGYWVSLGRGPAGSDITAAKVWKLVADWPKLSMDDQYYYASRIPLLAVVYKAYWVSRHLEEGLKKDGVLDLATVRGLVEEPSRPGVPAVRTDLVWETAIKLVRTGRYEGLLRGVVVPSDLVDLSRHGYRAGDPVRESDGREVRPAGWWGPVPVPAHGPAPVVPSSALPVYSEDGTVSSGVTLDPSVASVVNESLVETFTPLDKPELGRPFVESLFDTLDSTVETAPRPESMRDDWTSPIPDDPNPLTPERLTNEFGFPLVNQQRFQAMADRLNVIFDVRPTNPSAVYWLEQGAVAKPKDIKAKTVNELDVHLGADQSKVGLVGYFRPELPIYLDTLEPGLKAKIAKQFDVRTTEYASLASEMAELETEGRYRVVDGVVEAKTTDGTFKPITSDHDVYHIRNLDGMSLTTGDVDDVTFLLTNRNVGVQHGAHMYWEPVGTFQHKIFTDIVTRHQATTADAEPLIRFNPGQPPRLVFADGDARGDALHIEQHTQDGRTMHGVRSYASVQPSAAPHGGVSDGGTTSVETATVMTVATTAGDQLTPLDPAEVAAEQKLRDARAAVASARAGMLAAHAEVDQRVRERVQARHNDVTPLPKPTKADRKWVLSENADLRVRVRATQAALHQARDELNKASRELVAKSATAVRLIGPVAPTVLGDDSWFTSTAQTAEWFEPNNPVSESAIRAARQNAPVSIVRGRLVDVQRGDEDSRRPVDDVRRPEVPTDAYLQELEAKTEPLTEQEQEDLRRRREFDLLPPHERQAIREAEERDALDLGRGSLTFLYSNIIFDRRRFDVGGTTVQDFTVRLHLDVSGGATPQQVVALKRRALTGVNRFFNQGHRLPSGDQFHVTVQFVDSPDEAHHVVKVVADTDTFYSDANNWLLHDSEAVFAHEIGHLLGLRDEYPDNRLALRAKASATGVHDDRGLMTSGGEMETASIRPRNLFRIEKTADALGSVPEPASSGYRGQDVDPGPLLTGDPTIDVPDAPQTELADPVAAIPHLAAGVDLIDGTDLADDLEIMHLKAGGPGVLPDSASDLSELDLAAEIELVTFGGDTVDGSPALGLGLEFDRPAADVVEVPDAAVMGLGLTLGPPVASFGDVAEDSDSDSALLSPVSDQGGGFDEPETVELAEDPDAPVMSLGLTFDIPALDFKSEVKSEPSSPTFLDLDLDLGIAFQPSGQPLPESAPVVPRSALQVFSGDGIVSSRVTLDPSVASVVNGSLVESFTAVPESAVAVTSGPDGVVRDGIRRASSPGDVAASVPVGSGVDPVVGEDGFDASNVLAEVADDEVAASDGVVEVPFGVRQFRMDRKNPAYGSVVGYARDVAEAGIRAAAAGVALPTVTLTGLSATGSADHMTLRRMERVRGVFESALVAALSERGGHSLTVADFTIISGH